MLEGLWHQLGARLHTEVLHDRIFVKGHGALSYLEEVRDFLHCAAFARVAALPRWRAVSFSVAGSWPGGENTETRALGDERVT